LLLVACGSMACAPGIRADDTVHVDVELGVNYVVHVYTLARAGFRDEDYEARFGRTIPASDLEFLRRNAGLLSFLRQDSGPFAGPCYFAPAGMNLASRERFARYFSAWNRALKRKSFAPLEELHEPGLEKFRELFDLPDEAWRKQVLPLNPVFARIGRVFVGSFETYAREVWPTVEPVLEERARSLDAKLEPLGLVPAWETVTGYDFSDGGYHVSLYYAGRQGPSFNDTGLHKNTAYYGTDEAWFLDMISHEVGIHVMMPRLQPLLDRVRREIPRLTAPHVYGNVGYMAFESLAAYYNRKVLGRAGLDVHCPNDPSAFLEIFGKLDGPGASPGDLFQKGVAEYVANWTDPAAIGARAEACARR